MPVEMKPFEELIAKATTDVRMQKAYQIAITKALKEEADTIYDKIYVEQCECCCMVLAVEFGFTAKSLRKFIRRWKPIVKEACDRYQFGYHTDDATWIVHRYLKEQVGFDLREEMAAIQEEDND